MDAPGRSRGKFVLSAAAAKCDAYSVRRRRRRFLMRMNVRTHAITTMHPARVPAMTGVEEGLCVRALDGVEVEDADTDESDEEVPRCTNLVQ